MALVLEIPEKFARENRGYVNGIYRFDFSILKDGAFVCSLETAREFKDLLQGVSVSLRDVTEADFVDLIYNAVRDEYTEPERIIAGVAKIDKFLIVAIQPKVYPLGTATKFGCYLDTYNLKQNNPYLKARYILLNDANEIILDDTLETTNTTVVNNWKTNGDAWLVRRIGQLLNLSPL